MSVGINGVTPRDWRCGLNRARLSAAIVFLSFVGLFALPTHAQTQTVVQKYGQLRVQGNRIVDQTGQAVQLRGMSLYWSQWIPKYYTFNTVRWLRDDWKITVIRAAMAVNSGGYATNPTAERNKVIAVVDAAISLGIYVIIDYHDHTAHENRALAQAFFADMARRYGNTPNVLYETFNEPLNVSWAGVLKPYHEAVIDSIRQADPDNIVIVGTRNWSQEVDEAAQNPINRSNVAYTLHYYADTHRQWLRDRAQSALNRGVALFVTEYGTTAASGNGTVNAAESAAWYAFLDANKVGHANWSVADIGESSAALMPNASPDGGWSTSQIKPSGIIVRNELRAKAPDLSTGGGSSSGGGGSSSGGGTTDPVPAGTYSLRNRASGKMLDNLGSTADGANIGQWADGSSNNQRFVLSYTGGFAKLMCVTGSKFLDSINRTADNTVVGQWASSTSFNQQWTIQAVSGSPGYYRLINRANGKALDSGGATNDGGIMEFWGVGNTSNQQWQFVAP
ncbi:MAG TPA: cellulase family glycosylhydrolase [Steroidobacteraceae bacterium]|nr:cellulase family glycosylhydrolase [Steroidobacteraceae bacterium]